MIISDAQLDAVANWLNTTGIRIVLILLGMYILQRVGTEVATRMVRHYMQPDRFASERVEKKRAETLVAIIGTTLKVGLWIIAIMVILSEVGLDMGPLIASAGIAGVAIGFGAQSLVKDFFSGIFIILENQYRVGDVVEINGPGGVTGKVQALTMRTTILRDADGVAHYIPNGTITMASNLTMEFSGINLLIPVSIDSDLELVQKITDEVGQTMRDEPEWSKRIIEAPRFKRVENFAPSSIEIRVMGKVQAGKQWDVTGEFRRRLREAYREAGIEIPLPQQVMIQKTVNEKPAAKPKSSKPAKKS